MGCNCSTNEHPTKIDSYFEPTTLSPADTFFIRCSTVLADIEKIRAGLEDNRANFLAHSHANELQQPSMKEAVRIMLWNISANSGGIIQNAKPKTTMGPPYFSISLDKANQETSQLWNTSMDGLLQLRMLLPRSRI